MRIRYITMTANNTAVKGLRRNSSSWSHSVFCASEFPGTSGAGNRVSEKPALAETRIAPVLTHKHPKGGTRASEKTILVGNPVNRGDRASGGCPL